MATLCLVHGSTQNARCWDLLIPELARCGHHVITVDLPKSEPHFGISDFAAVILKEIPPTVSDLAIVGHSASGILLPEVAARRPVRILIYLAAMIPLPGSSVRTQVQTCADMFNPADAILSALGRAA